MASSLLILLVLFLGSNYALMHDLAGPSSRIIGGKQAKEGQYPYQVSLRKPQLPQNEHFCGGSIISPSWVLTGAHCVYRKPASTMIIVVGTTQLNAPGFSYGVEEVIWHGGYLQEIRLNDIALLKVAGSISLNSKVSPVSLAGLVTPGGVTCTLTGWGSTSQASTNLVNNLQTIELTSISVPECQLHIPNNTVFSTNVCTLEGAGRGACVGDSGGALVCGGEQHGVLSWDGGCAKGKPDVYTSVPLYRGWIKEKTGV